MSCETCKHYKKPPRLGYDEIVDEKGECHYMAIQGYHKKVNPNESCCMDISVAESINAEKLAKAAKRAAETGSRRDLREYLRLRKILL